MSRTKTNKVYTFSIPCKPYIRKYIEALYGNPFKADCYTSLGQFIIICLEKKLYNANKLPVKGTNYFTDKLVISASLHNYINVGSDIEPEKIVVINRFIEEIFSEHLYWWCQVHTQSDSRYKGYADAIRSFAEKHNILIDADKEDISPDGLKRKELRYRNAKEGQISFAGLKSKEERQRKFIEQRQQKVS